MMSTLHIEQLYDRLPLPSYAHEGDAGLDLYSAHTATFYPGTRRLMETGIRIVLPPGTVGLICPRSGLSHKKGITVINAPGIIDQGYHGEVKVNLINLSHNSQLIQAGDRIAQLVVVPMVRPEVVEVEKIWHNSARGEQGHGSTGQ